MWGYFSFEVIPEYFFLTLDKIQLLENHLPRYNKLTLNQSPSIKVWHDGIIFKLEQNYISGKLHKLLHDFLVNRKQRVVLNGRISSWTNVKAGVSQGSILGPLTFVIYINDLPKGPSSKTKLFADNTKLFSVIHDSSTTRNELNDNLVKISKWEYQWKMSFNPYPKTQAQEVIFSRKTKKINYSPV